MIDGDHGARTTVNMVLAAVVVDYDVGAPLTECLASLRDDGVRDVVVVENGDAAAARRLLHDAGLRVPVLDPGRNVGYGAGANRGVSALCQGRSDRVLVCNSDVRVHRGATIALASALDSDATLAVVAPRILTPEGVRYPSARRFPSPVDAVGHAVLGLVRPDNPFSRRYREGESRTRPDRSATGSQREEPAGGPAAGGDVSMADEQPGEVDWVSGSCLLVRRSAFQDLGGFDESYFMYAEDLDLCWRAHRRGWGVALVPAATVTHVQGLCTERHPYRMLAEHHRSALRFARRSTKGWRRVLLPAGGAVLGARLAANVGIRLLRGSAPR